MPTAEDFRRAMYQQFNEAFNRGSATVDIRAGDLHREVGGYPGRDHRMPVLCEVMWSAFAPDAGDIVIEEPPSRQGASLRIRYVLPRPEPLDTA